MKRQTFLWAVLFVVTLAACGDGNVDTAVIETSIDVASIGDPMRGHEIATVNRRVVLPTRERLRDYQRNRIQLVAESGRAGIAARLHGDRRPETARPGNRTIHVGDRNGHEPQR